MTKALEGIDWMLHMLRDDAARAFIDESNRIEGIRREASGKEIAAHIRFMELPEVTIKDLERFVSVFQPDAKLRRKEGMNVRLGGHLPPSGGPKIARELSFILKEANLRRGQPRYAYRVHCDYEMLHPFTDGNGRSGRMLWLWMMQDAPLGFLHTFYYQTLDAYGRDD